MADLGRRRHCVGRDRLRQGSRPDLSRRRQRQPVEPRHALERRGRQLVPLVGRRARRHDRQVQVALSGNAGRNVGLYRDAADHSRRAGGGRQAHQGAVPCAEERLLLHHRPHDRQADRRQAVCRRDQLGGGLRHGHRPPDRKSRGALLQDRQALHRDPGRARRAQLAPDELQSGDGARLHPRAADSASLSSGHERARPAQGRRLQRRHLADRNAAARRQGGVPRRGRGHDRPPRRLRPAHRQGRVGRRLSRGVERRHDDDRRQPRFPGNKYRALSRLCRRHRQTIARPRHAVGDRQRAFDLPRRRHPICRVPDEQGRRLSARRRGCGRGDAQGAQYPAPHRDEDRRHGKTPRPARLGGARVEPAAAVRHAGSGRGGQGAFRALLHRVSRRQRDRQRLHPRPARFGHARQCRRLEIGHHRRRAQGPRHGELRQGAEPRRC